MSLYGLDIIPKEPLTLIEINGVCSGMNGFRQVYGDDRVQLEVWNMLKQRYGKLSVDNMNKPISKKKRKRILKNLVTKTFSRVQSAHVNWLLEEVDSASEYFAPFDQYKGQDSTVINVINRLIQHPTVNPYVAEAITRNKFLQYWILKDSQLKQHLPKTAFVGMGATDNQAIDLILEKDIEQFILKPSKGSIGRGFKLLSGEEVKELKETRMPAIKPNRLELFLSFFDNPLVGQFKPYYLEDLVDNNNFIFESGSAVLQPFVDSKLNNKEYGIVRAIVCNGNFVDAYLRVSDEPRVNLTRGAVAKPFYKKGFADFCEQIVRTFEHHASLSPLRYKKELYNNYLDGIRITEEQRKTVTFLPMLDFLAVYRK